MKNKRFGIVILTLLTISAILIASESFENGEGQNYNLLFLVTPSGSSQDYIAEAIAKGEDDNTGQPLENIQTDDNKYYRVAGTCIGEGLLFLDEFDISGMVDSITSVVLYVQYLTDTNYDREGYIRWALDNGTLQNTTIQPHQTDIEVKESYNLFAQGVNTLAKIESLDIEFSNPGGWIPAPAIYFDYIWIEIGVENNISLYFEISTNNDHT